MNYYEKCIYQILRSLIVVSSLRYRVAALIKDELGIETKLVKGGRREFTVWVDDQVVAKKGWFSFPTEEKVLAGVKDALED